MNTDSIEAFISYSHEDEMLCKELEKHLILLERDGVITAWHDRDITAGSERADQIDQHLESAKVILLLISADFLASDFYDNIVKRSIERHNGGEACVIPVLLREVDWRGAPFSRLQVLPHNNKPVKSWSDRDEAFTDVTKGIREAVEQLTKPSLLEPSRTQSVTLNSEPNPPIQPLALKYPEGQVSLDSPFYVERNLVESCCYETVLEPGALLRIKAPRLMGKTSLMTRTLHHAASQKYKKVHLNLGEFELSIFTNPNEFSTNLDKFLRWFCLRVGWQLGLNDQRDKYWNYELMPCTFNCTDYFEVYLLPAIDSPLVIGLDEVDRIFPYADAASAFFRMLRSWHEKGKNQDIWRQLGLVISHSTEVYIQLSINESPFNVGVPVQLPEFTPAQVKNLAIRYGLSWYQSEVEQLMGMVGGHPYLIRLAMYHIARQEVMLDKLIRDAPTDEGIYGDHLRRHWNNLQQNPELADALKQIMTSPKPIKVDRMQGHKLHSMGLIEWKGAHVVPRCDLYRQYFSR